MPGAWIQNATGLSRVRNKDHMAGRQLAVVWMALNVHSWHQVIIVVHGVVVLRSGPLRGGAEWEVFPARPQSVFGLPSHQLIFPSYSHSAEGATCHAAPKSSPEGT